LKLGFSVAQSTVAKYMTKKGDPSGQSWGTFLRNHMPHIAAMDLFVVPTISFNLLYVMVIVRLARRELVWINVTAHPTAEWIAQQISEAFPWQEAPRYLIRDRNGIYGTEVRRCLASLNVEEVLTAARSPCQSPYVERLIGSNRRECLNHVIILNGDIYDGFCPLIWGNIIKHGRTVDWTTIVLSRVQWNYPSVAGSLPS